VLHSNVTITLLSRTVEPTDNIFCNVDCRQQQTVADVKNAMETSISDHQVRAASLRADLARHLETV